MKVVDMHCDTLLRTLEHESGSLYDGEGMQSISQMKEAKQINNSLANIKKLIDSNLYDVEILTHVNSEVERKLKEEYINKISEEDLKEQYQSEIAAGLRQPWEYRMKFFGEDETTAKKMIEDEEISKQDEE